MDWKKVEDEVPTMDDIMLVYPRKDYLAASYYPWPDYKGMKQGAWYVDDQNGYPYEVHVTHWMPQPEPPEDSK